MDEDLKVAEQRRLKLGRARKSFFVVVVLLVFCSVFWGGYTLGHRGISVRIGNKQVVNIDSGRPSDVDFSLFWEAWNKVKEKSVYETDNKKMTEGSISGLLSSFGDPYTTYFTKEENQRFREDIQGEFFGIGIEITEKNGVPTVVAPISGTPADKAGLKPGDIIYEIDGQKTADIGVNEVIDRIRGAEGTKVTLQVIREKVDNPLTFEVIRAKITVKSLSFEEKDYSGKKVAYIKINQFGDDTEGLFKDAADKIVKDNPEGIVIDLRNNPGGYLDTAVNIASYFIKDGLIVSEKGKDNKNNRDYKSTGNGRLKDFKVTVLTNGGSASASEILAGALQDRKGSKLIGEKTFGKGSVQELIDLSDGSSVKITVAKWYTPNGRTINGTGLEADIKVLDDEKTTVDEQLNRALEFIVAQ